MKFSDAIPSKYLQASDLRGKQVKLTMMHVAAETMTDGKAKPILYFMKAKKGLVLNKTNGLVIAAAYGDEMDRWSGKEIILFSMKVQFKEKIVDAIRVEIPMNTVKPAPAPVVDDDEMPD